MEGLDNKNSLEHKDNSLKQLKTANPNSLWALFSGGRIIGGFFASGAYFREGLFLEGPVFGI